MAERESSCLVSSRYLSAKTIGENTFISVVCYSFFFFFFQKKRRGKVRRWVYRVNFCGSDGIFPDGGFLVGEVVVFSRNWGPECLPGWSSV